MVALPGTPMPAARVRLLQLDSATRDVLARAGITDSQPAAFIAAAPYGSDCRTIRWMDTTPWVVTGDVGFMRANLRGRAGWVGGVPVFVIPQVWDYPYPRQRGLAFLTPLDPRLTPADAMYSLDIALDIRRAVGDSARRARAVEWARSHPAAAELEPARSIIRREVLSRAWEEVRDVPSRLRGTYRVTVESGNASGTWLFRTYDRRAYSWPEAESARSTADVLASPHAVGYQLPGFAAATREGLPDARNSAESRGPLVLLAATDRPTVPGNAERRTLSGELEFALRVAPVPLWNDLEAHVPPPTALDSAFIVASGSWPVVMRGDRRPRLPLTLRIDTGGVVRADTTLMKNGRSVRVQLERMDTVSVRWPY
jgi:hypothetical protein